MTSFCANSIEILGTLVHSASNGKLAFFRLVGCAYFRKHRASFLPAFSTPARLPEVNNQSPHTHHNAWLDAIRERIWCRIQYEEEMVPSDGALLRHWQRACWVLSVWQQACSNHVTYPPLNGNGWIQQPGSNTLLIDWDSEENISKE